MHRFHRDLNLKVTPMTKAEASKHKLSPKDEAMFRSGISPREFVRVYESGELGSIAWDHRQPLEDYIKNVKAGKYD